ncbi:hypothetical protein MML48_scaffold00021672 [Holotrichia oblita]|nr:hypothetical protein MML48_scaffold00021672 [Holotrichia oblita]
MDKMFERLQTMEKRLVWIDKMLENPNFLADIEQVKKISKERSQIEKVVEKYREYLDTEKNIEELTQLANDDDEDMAILAKEQLKGFEKTKDILLEEIRLELIPKDPNDAKNVIVEIRGAAGGDEGNIFAGDLFRMYTRYAESKNWQIQILDSSEADLGGFSLISFSIKGDSVYSKLKFESGAHRVQRVPRTESQGRIHTSTATVIVMPEADDIDIHISPDELQIDFFRSSGAGGQHVNKTDSAVRITHIPTGTVVTCQDGRSQHDNKATAMMMLKTKVLDAREKAAELERSVERKSKIGTGERSEKIRTYNYPQNRVTDHRIGLSVQQLDRIINGMLDPIINALIDEEQKERLANNGY